MKNAVRFPFLGGVFFFMTGGSAFCGLTLWAKRGLVAGEARTDAGMSLEDKA